MGITSVYNFESPHQMRIVEEYLIYDAFAMIGAIGGTLGLFIGFSFSDIISLGLKNLCNCFNVFNCPGNSTTLPEEVPSSLANKIDRLCKDLEDMKRQLNRKQQIIELQS